MPKNETKNEKVSAGFLAIIGLIIQYGPAAMALIQQLIDAAKKLRPANDGSDEPVAP